MSKTKQRIIQATHEVLFNNASAPLEKIAEVAGVSRMTLHRHFTNRETLIEAAITAVLAEWRRVLETAVVQNSTPLQQLRQVMHRMIQMDTSFHFLFHFAGNMPNNWMAEAQELNNKLIQLFAQLKADGHMRVDLPNDWILHLFDGILTSAWRSYTEGTVAPKRIPQLAWDAFYQATFV